MANAKIRRFCFTWNNYPLEAYTKCEEFIKNKCKYGIVGEEICPNTGTLHLQGFCNLHKPTRFNAIKRDLDNSIHIEKANGSDIDNQTYCSKSGIFFESGIPSKQGKRSDLMQVVETITKSEVPPTLEDIATKHPVEYIRYFRGIEKLQSILRPVCARRFKTDVYYYWGAPGTGKSRTALEEAEKITTTSIYYKPRGLWWDGYRQQTCVIIDDFYGWIKYDEMLKIMDRYPYKVQVKGGFEEFTSKHIWITSNIDTDLLYKFSNYSNVAFERRLTIKKHFIQLQ
ncbi:replication-associated protein [Dragonfly associated cyclovirus 7]|uniref:Replication-associated protein n=1 Tax=Dragonfly associated cyclovirus 7 TaxID=1574361 RepID=M9V5D4_9CIRC|nr:replication-associated protein [Dragonfly associated cyclovirus 7]AGJ74758.1 replication-associated protein [Dragonfly associated cyclovirus 7]